MSAVGPVATDVRAMRDWLALLSTLSEDINLTSENIEHSLPALLERVAREVSCDGLAVWVVQEDTDALSIYQSVGLSERFVRYFNHTDLIRAGSGLLGISATESVSKSISSPEGMDALGPARWKEMFVEEGIGAVIAVPMQIGSRSLGVFTAFYRHKTHEFSPAEQFFFEVLANQIAISYENFLNYRSIETNREELKSQVAKLINLQSSFQAINQYLNQSVDHALAFLSKYLAHTFQGQGVAIFEPGGSGKLELTAAHNLSSHYWEAARTHPVEISSETSLIARAYREQEPHLSERVFTDDRLGKDWIRVLSEDRLTAEAAFPLQVQDRVFGVLVVYYDHLHSYTDEEASVIGAFSQFLAILFENREIFSSLVSEKQKTQSIVYSLQDGIVAYDLDGTVTDVNPRGVKLLGISKDDVMGKNPLSIQSEDPGIRNAQEVSRLVIPDFDTRSIVIPHPQDTAIEVTQVPLHQENYRKVGSIRILHDVSEERRAEQLKTNFVSTATHQLRTPLTGVRWGLGILASEQAGPLTAKQRELIGKLSGTTEFLVSLVNDLLNTSRAEEGRIQYVFKKQSILPIIKTVLKEIAVQVEEKKIVLTIDAPAEDSIPPVAIDETRITIALQNLFDNAVKYTPTGGAVTIRVYPAESSLVVAISDTGIGISKEDQRLLFNKFFRGENAVRIQTEGSGLGLFLARTIVEAHNAKLSVDSILGKGTTFYIQFPLDESLMPALSNGDNPQA